MSSQATATASSTHAPLPALDGVRCLATILIVWFHTPGMPWRPVASAGGAIFLVTTFGLSSLRPRPAPFVEFLRRRAARLLVPFAFWSGVYLLVRLRLARHDSLQLSSIWTPSAVLSGFSSHLWYLSFAFPGLIATWLVLRATERLDVRTTIVATSLVGVLLMAAILRATGHSELTMPWGQWICSVPSIFVGIAVGRTTLLPRPAQRRLAAVGIALATEASAAWLLFQGYVDTTFAAAIGVPIACAAFVLSVPGHPAMTWLGRRTLGIYVLHPLVSLAVIKFAGAGFSPVLGFVATYVGSVVATAAMTRLPVVKFLV